jgi:hypothetical protein
LSDHPPTTDLAVVPDDLAVLTAIETITGSQALALLRQAANAIGLLAEQYRGDPYATGTAAVYVDTLMRDLRAVLKDLKKWTNEAMPAKSLTIPGVGTIERAGENAKDTWDDERVMAAVMDWARAQGIINGPADVPPVLLEFAAIGYWRKTALKKAGIGYYDDRDPETGEQIEGTGMLQTTKGDPSIRVVARAD